MDWLIKWHPDWKTIRSIGMIETMREINDVQTSERRYFISSIKANPVLFMKTVRAHWGVENSLHYVLDLAFKEDACRIKKGTHRKTCLSLGKSP